MQADSRVAIKTPAPNVPKALLNGYKVFSVEYYYALQIFPFAHFPFVFFVKSKRNINFCISYMIFMLIENELQQILFHCDSWNALTIGVNKNLKKKN